MPDRDPELQIRVCRACNASYDYPVIKSRATRFYCETCAQLPDDSRAVFESMNKRLKDLEKKLASKPAPPKPPAPAAPHA